MKMKHHTVFVLQNKLLESMLIYYRYRILKIIVIFLIKDFNRFMVNKTKHHRKKHFCQYCLQCFPNSKVLECHIKNCFANNHIKSVFRPEQGQYINFKNSKRLIKGPFIIYGDFECVLIPSNDNIDFGLNTKEYQDHIVWSYGYKLICVDDHWQICYWQIFK